MERAKGTCRGHIVCWIVKGEFALGEPVNVLPSHEVGLFWQTIKRGNWGYRSD